MHSTIRSTPLVASPGHAWRARVGQRPEPQAASDHRGPSDNDNFLNMRTFIVPLIGAKGAFPFTQDIPSKYADFQWAAPNHWRLRGEFAGASGNAALMGLSLA